MKPRTLIVDDEKNIRRTLGLILTGIGHRVSEAGSGEEALAQLNDAPADLVILDVGLPGMDGLATLREIRAIVPQAAVVMISGQGTVAIAVEATRLGAFDFLEKPLSKDRVVIAVRNALEASNLGAAIGRQRHDEARRHAMIGASAAIEALQQQITRVAPTNATILVTGESGSGKELVARAIHEASPRAGNAFIKVNCAAIPEELIESELFGCVRGAFTGADRSRDGKFLLADGGTLFLDEIGDMSVRVQAKVLRALQEGEIQRVGDTKTNHVDVRVVAATNKNLETQVAAGAFREDLFFRLNVIPLTVPPLRERTEDIDPLARHFLQLYAAENQVPARTLAPGALARMRGMAWRGNIRELKNVIERLAILSTGAVIEDADVTALAPGAAVGLLRAAGASVREANLDSRDDFGTDLDQVRAAGGLVQARRDFEKRCIEAALDASGGNVSQAAQWLMVERSNLHKKMQTYGLEARPPRPNGQSDTHKENES